MSPAAGAAAKPPPEFNRRFLRRAQAVARVLTHHVLLRTTVHGLENIPADGPLILAGNHSSWLDGPMVVTEASRPVRCLTKSELYGGRLGRFLHYIGQIPVDRGKPDRSALRACLAELEAGGAVGVFPEGTRGAGELEAVQDGIAYLAVRAGCPVLPVACVGTSEALPKGAKFPKRVPVTIYFGKPFDVGVPANPRSRKALAEVGEAIRVRLVEHLAAARALHG